VAVGPVQAAPTAAAKAKTTVNTDKWDSGNSCHLGNGVQHVVQITFDNVHFYRDNPNVPSDLEQMPNLLDFFESNGTFLSNNHTPLIAHRPSTSSTRRGSWQLLRRANPIPTALRGAQATSLGAP
jgi:hypothetical protein